MSDLNDFIKTPALLAVAALVFITTLVGGLYSFQTWYMPAREELQRQTYQESRSFVRGKIQRLNALRMDYQDASAGHRAVIRETALSEAATVNDDDLPEHLRTWIQQLQAN